MKKKGEKGPMTWPISNIFCVIENGPNWFNPF